MNPVSSDRFEKIGKYLAGECDSLQEQEMLSWIAESAQNRDLFKKIRDRWDSFELLDVPLQEPEVDAIWSQFKRKVYPVRTQVFFSPVFYRRLAASVAVLVALVYFSVSFFSVDEEWMSVVGDQEMSEVKLADGTKVQLYPGSTLRFPRQFSNSRREVFVKGSAYFNVAKDASKPFIVHNKMSVTRVLGTSFVVDFDSLLNRSSITVLSGTVEFSADQSKKKLILTKDEQAWLSSDLTLHKNERRSLNQIAWLTGKLVFDNAPGDEVLAVLSRYYNVTFSFANACGKNMRLTSTLDHQSLSQAMDILAFTWDASIKNTSDHYTIDVAPCN